MITYIYLFSHWIKFVVTVFLNHFFKGYEIGIVNKSDVSIRFLIDFSHSIICELFNSSRATYHRNKTQNFEVNQNLSQSVLIEFY